MDGPGAMVAVAAESGAEAAALACVGQAKSWQFHLAANWSGVGAMVSTPHGGRVLIAGSPATGKSELGVSVKIISQGKYYVNAFAHQ